MDTVSVRFFHLLGTILLLGNVTVTAFWALYFYRVRDTVPFRRVARAMRLADFIFTLVGVTLIGVTGFTLLKARGIPFETPWVIRGASALGLAVLLWIAVLLPLLTRLARHPSDDRRALRRIFTAWMVGVWTVAGILIYGLVVMVRR